VSRRMPVLRHHSCIGQVVGSLASFCDRSSIDGFNAVRDGCFTNFSAHSSGALDSCGRIRCLWPSCASTSTMKGFIPSTERQRGCRCYTFSCTNSLTYSAPYVMRQFKRRTSSPGGRWW
jgi:hypothetical protein